MRKNKNAELLYICSLIIVIVYLAISNYEEIVSFSNVFLGIGYRIDFLRYAITLCIVGVLLFSGFGESRRFVLGYGICHLIRTKKRHEISLKVMKLQLIRVVKLSFIMICTHTAVVLCFKQLAFSFEDLGYILLFMLMAYSLLLWQSILELKLDERKSIIIVLCMFIAMIFLEGERMFYGMNERWVLLLYINMGLKGRMNQMTFGFPLAIGFILMIILLQGILMIRCMKKKDII